jgi:hypothetical protein
MRLAWEACWIYRAWRIPNEANGFSRNIDSRKGEFGDSVVQNYDRLEWKTLGSCMFFFSFKNTAHVRILAFNCGKVEYVWLYDLWVR